jgi:hypothetical protein
LEIDNGIAISTDSKWSRFKSTKESTSESFAIVKIHRGIFNGEAINGEKQKKPHRFSLVLSAIFHRLFASAPRVGARKKGRRVLMNNKLCPKNKKFAFIIVLNYAKYIFMTL